jgi:hypothetical protein
MLALHALPGTDKPLWEDAGRELLHAPRRRRHRLARAPLWRHVDRRHAGGVRVRARLVPVGRRPAGAGVRARPARPVCAHLRLLRPAPASASWTPRSTPRAPAMRWTPSRSCTRMLPEHYRDLISHGRDPAGLALEQPAARCPSPPRPRVAPRQELPDHAARHLRPDEKAQRWLLTVRPATASACCTHRPGAGAPPASTCSWPRSARWASGWKTPSWSTARNCSRNRADRDRDRAAGGAGLGAVNRGYCGPLRR